MLFNFVPGSVPDLAGRRAGVSKPVLLWLVAWMVFSSAMVACAGEAPEKEVEMTLSVSSTAFQEGDKIPVKYTCDGQDISPPLVWGEPTSAQSFALIVDDLDAHGVFTHWVLYNLPADVRQMGEGTPARERLENGAQQGENDFGRIGYGGPCPPRGHTHRYRFTIYALDTSLDLEPGASKKQLLDAMEGHILAQGRLTGTYQR